MWNKSIGREGRGRGGLITEEGKCMNLRRSCREGKVEEGSVEGGRGLCRMGKFHGRGSVQDRKKVPKS